MAGASGFLGTRLADRLRGAGHDVTRLVRRPAQRPDEATWQPSQGQLDPTLVAAADAARFLVSIKERLEAGHFEGDLGLS